MSYVSCAFSFQSRLRILQYTRTTQQTTNRKERMMQYSCHKCGISDCYIYCHLMVANMMLATFNFSTVELEYFLPKKKHCLQFIECAIQCWITYLWTYFVHYLLQKCWKRRTLNVYWTMNIVSCVYGYSAVDHHHLPKKRLHYMMMTRNKVSAMRVTKTLLRW